MRGLTAATAPLSPDLDAAVGAVLDRRLRRDLKRPIALALSGGGDSVALTLAAAAWARDAGRPLLVLTVDHGLRPESTGWTATCAAIAARLGADFEALAWTGPKPASGLPAAARAARHALLAGAARAAAASVILMGHTADDVLEARRMRAAGATTPEPREWSPSPAWPEGRGVFLLRPLLDVSRADLRAGLAGRGETWIEDPANDDQRFARARARRADGAAPPAPPQAASTAALALATGPTADGGLVIPRAALIAADPDTARRYVAAACLCAAGTTRPPSAERAARLTAKLTGAGDAVATLAGARIEAGAETVRFSREAGEAARGGLAPITLAAGGTAVWDGRFEVASDRPAEVRRLAGLARQLPREQQAALKRLPAASRPALPLVAGAGSPLLGDIPELRIRALAHARLLAACGAVEREPS